MSRSTQSLVSLLKKRRESLVGLALFLILLFISLQAWEARKEQQTSDLKVIRRVLDQYEYQDVSGRRGGSADSDVSSVVNQILTPPDRNQFVKIFVQADPFKPRQEIEQIRQMIREAMVQVMVEMENGNWSQAIEGLDRVLALDPMGHRYSYEVPPGELRRRCQDELNRNEIVRLRGQADEYFRQAEEILAQEEYLRARNQYVSSRRAYQAILRIDPERRIRDAEFYRELDTRLVQLDDRIRTLSARTLPEQVDQGMIQAREQMALYEADNGNVMALENARSVLTGLVELIDEFGSDIISRERYGEIRQDLRFVEEKIQAILPQIVKEAQDTLAQVQRTQNVEARYELLSKARDYFSILTSLVPNEEEYTTALEEINVQLSRLRKTRNERLALEFLTGAQRDYQSGLRAKDSMDERGMQQSRAAALEKLDRILDIPEEDLTQQIRQDMANLREVIQSRLVMEMPPVADAVLLRIFPDNRSALISYRTRQGRHTLGQSNPTTRLTLTEVQANANPPYVVVQLEGHALTKLELRD